MIDSCQTVDADSRRRFLQYETVALGSYSLRMHVIQLYEAALKRPENKDPFLRWWSCVSHELTGRGMEMQCAMHDFRSLEALLDGSVSKLQEWKKQYDVVVDKMGRWALEQQKVLANDQVSKFVANEEALVAARAA